MVSPGRLLHSSGMSAVVVLVENVVVADDPDAIARIDITVFVRLDATVGFFAEGLGVIGQALICVELPDDARREPDLANGAAIKQLCEALAVVLVRMRQREHSEVRLVVDHRQDLIDERVHNRVVWLIVVLSRFVMLDIDLQHDAFVDQDGCAVAAPNRPENESSIWKFNGHPLLLLCM